MDRQDERCGTDGDEANEVGVMYVFLCGRNRVHRLTALVSFPSSLLLPKCAGSDEAAIRCAGLWQGVDTYTVAGCPARLEQEVHEGHKSDEREGSG